MRIKLQRKKQTKQNKDTNWLSADDLQLRPIDKNTVGMTKIFTGHRMNSGFDEMSWKEELTERFNW